MMDKILISIIPRLKPRREKVRSHDKTEQRAATVGKD